VARAKIGELLLQAKALTREQLDEALRAQEGSAKRIGEILLDRGAITEAQLIQALSLQLSIPWVSLSHVDFSQPLLNRIPMEAAEKYCLIPIFVRNVKGQGETLYVATDDPGNEHALAEASRYAALPVRPMIASRNDIRSAIRVYYGGQPDSAEMLAANPVGAPTVPEQRAAPPPPPPRSQGEQRAADVQPDARVAPPPAPPPKPVEPIAIATRVDAPIALATAPAAFVPPRPADPIAPIAAPPPRPADPPAAIARPADPPIAPQVAPVIQTRPVATIPEIDVEHEPATSATKTGAAALRALTFLDGTALAIPARSKSRPASAPPNEFTTRDLISALRLMAHGADASDILGENPRIEAMFAALLSLMLKRGLITDHDFVEEYRKI
jgi:type IV pilus assembly protein PilB